MQLNIILDDQLLNDAQQASGLSSTQATIEMALQVLIKQFPPETTKLLEKLNQAYSNETDDAIYLKKMSRLYSASLRDVW